jgi:ADP-heptose:LPS heptosyltransferase
LKNWIELLRTLIAREYSICLMGGSWDDLTRAIQYELPNFACLNLVGQTSFPEACAVHKLCKFYIGFSSGLGIIRTVMGLPTIMLWPEHQAALSTSWADPEDVESRRYIASRYVEPRAIYNIFKIQESLFEG